VFVILQCVACATRGPGADGVSAIGLTPQEWAALSQPSSAHNLLQRFVGEWEVKLTFWSAPGAQGQSSHGHSSITWILGRRFVQEQFKGQALGASFEGMGILGYDNGAREFKTLWLDSLNTAMTVATGRYAPDTQTFELESELYDPLRSGIKVVRSTLRFTSSDSYVFTMQDESPEGKSFTALEMVYVRQTRPHS
jgi:hypothetical protein